LIKALADPDRTVRATALEALTNAPDPLAEPAIIPLTMSIDPQLGKAAVVALSELDTPTARDAIRQTMKSGLTERARACATRVLAASKDDKMAGDIMVLLASRSWQTRLASAQALGVLPSPQTAIIRLTYLQQADPQIKLAATLPVDPTREYEQRKMQWSAVNETSDLVRLVSLEKLIQSQDAAFRADGYKGVRDDSVWVRAELLKWLGEQKDNAHRSAVLLGVADSHASVRAAGLRALAQLPAPVTLEELGSVLGDKHPDVQMALIRLAKGKKLALPDTTLVLMKASPSSAVRDLLNSVEREESFRR
jgi:HEAT repeat protein